LAIGEITQPAKGTRTRVSRVWFPCLVRRTERLRNYIAHSGPPGRGRAFDYDRNAPTRKGSEERWWLCHDVGKKRTRRGRGRLGLLLISLPSRICVYAEPKPRILYESFLVQSVV